MTGTYRPHKLALGFGEVGLNRSLPVHICRVIELTAQTAHKLFHFIG
jgi:hypothetical protein